MKSLFARGVCMAAVTWMSCAPALAGQEPTRSQVPLTFSAAIQQMRDRHEAFAAADAEVRARIAERASARSLYLPKVDTNWRATRIDAPITIDLDPIRSVLLGLHRTVPSSLIPAFDMNVQDQNFWRADVRATWPVFTGGKVSAANQAAEAQVKDSVGQKRQLEQSLTTELVRRYFGVRLALRVRDVRAQVLAGLDKHVQDATRLEAEGLIARAERLHAEVARDGADRELKKAEQDLQIARAALANILSADYAADPVSPLFLAPDVGPLSEFKTAAASTNPAVARLAAQEDLAEQGLRAEKGRWLPDVYLFGLRELHQADLTMLDPKWAAGVGATFTLFDGFERGHRVAAAQLRRERVRDLEERARRDVQTLVEQRYREMSKAVEQYNFLASATRLAEENLRVRTRAFEEGLGTSLDVVDARLALSRVQLDRLVAGFDFDLALAGLLEASGQAERFEQFQARGRSIEDDREQQR